LVDGRAEPGFAATRWTLIERLRCGSDADRREAAETLARMYQGAVYAYLRRKGHGGDAASELTQSFFTEVVLGRGLFERARQERGRMRTLMLTALDNYLIDLARSGERSRTTAAPNRLLERAEREERLLASSDGRPPDEVFERRWALAALEEAVRRCERHFVGGGRERHWRAFEARVIGPAVFGTAPPPLRDLAASLGAASPADVASMVQVVRKRLKALLQEVAAETVDDEAQRREEYARLISLLT
jgi:DNA-directed RNA polymerase specialized sigma24 family protein